MKRERDEETAVGKGMAVQVAKFHTQVFKSHQDLRQPFQKITKQLAEIDKKMEALIKSSGFAQSSNYRANTLKYFQDITADPSAAKITYFLNCGSDCLSWPDALQPKVINLYEMTTELAEDALSIKSLPQLANVTPPDPVQSEKTSENWLDDIDFTLII